MADNIFAGRTGETSDVNVNEFIVSELIKEFPNDPVLREGKLSATDTVRSLPVTSLAKRNVTSGLLEIDADVSAIYAQYNLSKLVPGASDTELDDALDDEFTTFVIDDTGLIPARVVTGLFFITSVTPGDYHDMYTQFGVERIPEMMANGVDDVDIKDNLFCVWYVERNKARPIPNYKTLEVMLVERELTYDSISVASPEDIIQYDLNLDGRFAESSDVDENGNLLTPPTFVDELAVRQLLNRVHEWNPKIRYLSGYRPGKAFNPAITSMGAQFLRDPGEYVRLKETRVASYTETSKDANGIDVTTIVLPREARQRQEILALMAGNDIATKQRLGLMDFTGVIDPVSTPQLFSLLEEDPMDLYYDAAFRQTRIETIRAELEGKLVIPAWSKSSFETIFNDIISAGTDELRFDDLFLGLSMMVFGHFKQIMDINTLKRIATDLNVDISNYDSSLEVKIPGTDVLDENQFEALSDIKGIINILFQQGVITVLGGVTDERWTTFAKIGNVDQLDVTEYEKYRSEYYNVFEIEEIVPYEPIGSTVYYQQTQLSRNYLANLQTQAILQEQIDKIRRDIYEKLIPVQVAINEMETSLASVPPDFVKKLQNMFGPESDVQNVLSDLTNTAGSANYWVLWKKKNNGSLKDKGRQDSLFKLLQTEWQIKVDSMNAESEDKIFNGGDETRPYWFINGYINDATISVFRAGYFASSANAKLVLFDNKMREALIDAGDTRLGLSSKNIFSKPSAGDSNDRIDSLFKNKHYFRAGTAKYIGAVILQLPTSSGGNQNKYKLPGYPTTILESINAPKPTPGDMVSICEKVTEFLNTTKVALNEVKLELVDYDEKLVFCNNPAELIELNASLHDVLKLKDRLNTEMFSSIVALDAYIDSSHLTLMKRIVEGIDLVRKKVHNKNDKYYIQWPTLSVNRVRRWIPDHNFIKYQPS